MNKVAAAGLFVAGCFSWYSPGFSGIFFDPVNIGAGDGRIIAAIFIVGAAIVWFMPQPKSGS